VAYDGNGNTSGSAPSDTTAYLPGATVTVSGNTGSLVKTGATFAGWNTKADGTGTAYAAAATFTITSNLTLYASWTTLLTYRVTYHGNGNTGGAVPSDANTYVSGATVTAAGNTGSLVKTGATFAGWNTKADGTGTAYAGAATFTITAHLTLYAVWTTLPTFLVTYAGNGNTGGSVPLDANAYLAGARVTVAGNTGSLTKTGAAFAGWNTKADATGTAYAAAATLTVAANLTLYAVWTTLPTFRVTYDGNGGTGGAVPSDTTAYLTGATVTVAGNTGGLAKSGATFAGWNSQADGTGTAYATAATLTIATNLTLYAVWTTLPTYRVTYDGNGSTGGSVPSDANAYLTGATVTVVGNSGSLAKTYFAFNGWNTAADGTGTAYAVGSTFTIAGANVTLYAVWTAATGTAGVSASAPIAVTVSLSLGASTVTQGTAVTGTATPSAAVDRYTWYLDGVAVAGQTTASFSGGASLGKGPHTLTVVVQKNSINYSASTLVTVR